MITSKIDFSRQFGTKPRNPKLSIVIVTYNTGNELFDCLDSLQKQSENSFELILVDNGKANLKQLQNYNLSYYHSKYNDGPSPSRNFGIQVARSQIIAFLDDDAIATVDWTKNVLSSFSQREVVGIRGKIHPKSSSNILNRLQAHYNLGDNAFNYFVDLEGNSAFKKIALLAVGGFSPELFGHEGVELCYRLSNQYPKSRILYMPSVVILHDYSDSLMHLVRKVWRHGYVSTRFGSKNTEIEKYQKQFKVPTNGIHSSLAVRVLRLLLLGINLGGRLWCKILERLWLLKYPARVKK